MSILDDIPSVKSFIGMPLKSGTIVIAILGIVHPLFYARCFYVPSTPRMITTWLLVLMYFVVSVILLVGAIQADGYMVSIWVWYAIFFLIIMLVIMIINTLVYKYRTWDFYLTILGIAWYLLTIYFIFVVNSYRKQISKR